MQPDSALPNQFHRNCVIGRATDKLDPIPVTPATTMGAIAATWELSPGSARSARPVPKVSFLSCIRRSNSMPCRAPPAMADGVLGSAMSLIAAEDPGGICRGR
jgi:hypothetical protein